MAQQQLTPMMQQYRQIKNDHPTAFSFSVSATFMRCLTKTPAPLPGSWT